MESFNLVLECKECVADSPSFGRFDGVMPRENVLVSVNQYKPYSHVFELPDELDDAQYVLGVPTADSGR